jgi:CDGSH-type Zn-finger protein
MAPEKNKVRVTVSENGPHIVTGDIALAKQTIAADAEGGSEAWQKGPDVAHRETYALCRCGASQTKPFCDGSHLKTGFDGAETASRDAYLDQAKVVDGPILQLTDAESLCAFGRFCDPNGNVWSQVTQIDDPEIRTMFIRQVNECPSGRLVAWDKASGRTVEEALPVSIGLIEDPEQQCSGRCGCKVGYRSSPRTGLNMKCVIASRFVAVERRRTSRSVTAHTRRSNSETLLRSGRIAEEGFSRGDGR